MNTKITTKPVLDFLVKVDRSIKPNYPLWMIDVLDPELELDGPNQFDLQNDVSLWLHENQKTSYATGNQIYRQLKKDYLLKDCQNLTDLLGIQQKGIEVFRSLYDGKSVFGWKSIVQEGRLDLYVPYLFELNGELDLRWFLLDDRLSSNSPALRFSK